MVYYVCMHSQCVEMLIIHARTVDVYVCRFLGSMLAAHRTRPHRLQLVAAAVVPNNRIRY